MSFAAALVLAALLNLLLIPIFGTNGAAAAVLLVEFFWASWLHVLVVRHLGIQTSVLAAGRAFRKKGR